jgi:hypothetical protein
MYDIGRTSAKDFSDVAIRASWSRVFFLSRYIARSLKYSIAQPERSNKEPNIAAITIPSGVTVSSGTSIATEAERLAERAVEVASGAAEPDNILVGQPEM